MGGLTLGLKLHQRGIQSTVLESAAEVKPLGVALADAVRGYASLADFAVPAQSGTWA
jgi:2-polyprenyl-6-methoxyphenol hydroxylase-like FAD-dependent oxidoreductase